LVFEGQSPSSVRVLDQVLVDARWREVSACQPVIGVTVLSACPSGQDGIACLPILLNLPKETVRPAVTEGLKVGSGATVMEKGQGNI